MRILVCDDDRAWLRAMSRALNAEVLQASTIEAALTVAEKMEPNVLLLDAMLPDGIGWQAIPCFRAASPRTEIVVVTAHPRRTDALRTIGEHRAFAYLDKCESLEVIRRVVRQAFMASVVGAVRERARPAARMAAVVR